jgi:hypothetical protein
MMSESSLKLCEAMDGELRSMSSNGVWEIRNGAKKVACKWVYKTKYVSKGKIERFKTRLVAKVLTIREGIDYTKTSSPVSKKDSFRIAMTLVAHFDLELQQINVKTSLLNVILHEDVYMVQLEGFVVKVKELMRCKFHEVIKQFGFIKNKMDNCIYIKIKGSMFIILVLYVDDILLASSDKNLLHETKEFLSSNFGMKDLGDASNVLGTEIYRDKSKGVLGLSQKTYFEKVLKRYNMYKCSTTVALVVKGGKIGAFQSPRDQLEIDKMKSIPYASAVRSITHAQVCIDHDLTFINGLFGIFQSNPGMGH